MMADEPTVPRPARARPRPPRVDDQTVPNAETPPSVTPTVRTRDDQKLYASLVQMYEGIGGIAFVVGFPRGDDRLLNITHTLTQPKQAVDPMTGLVRIVDSRTGAEVVADAWLTAASNNPRLKTTLKRFTEGGAIAEVAALHFALLLPFLPGIPGLSFLTNTADHTTPTDTGAFNGAPVA